MPEDIPVSDLPALDLDESDDEIALDLDESDDEASTPSPTPLNRPPVYETPAPTPLVPMTTLPPTASGHPESSHIPIDDKTAANYLRELNGMYPGENDARAQELTSELDLYAAHEPERRKRDERQYLRDIFTDDEAMKEFADTDDMRQREKFSVDPNLERYRAANWMQLEHELGRPIKDDLDYETQRNAVSRERNGKPATSDTDFYQARRKEYQLDKTLELARTELIGKGITKAVADQALGQPTEVTSVIDEVVSHYPDAFPTDAARDQAAVVLRDSTAMVRDVTEKLRPDLAAALPVIQKMVSKTATDEDAMTLYRLFGSKITEGNRKDVGAIIGLAEMVLNSQGQELDRSLVMTELENAKKAFFRDGFAWIPQGNITQQEDQVELARMAISDGSARIGENGRLIFSPLGEGLPGAPTRGRPLTNEEKAFHDERLSAAMDVMQAQRIVNDALAKKLDPIEYLGREGTFWGTTERMALDAIQSAPYMGSAVAAGILGSLAGGPIGGTAASMAMMHYMDAQTQLQDLTINNPELPRETRKSYANWSAAAQLPFNYLEVELFLGRFPVLAGIFRDLKAGNLFGAIAKGGGDLAARQFLEFGAESVQNGISDLTAIIAENAKSSLSANMHQVWDQAVENGPRTFFALLPYTLIGTGMASLNDYGVHAKELLAVDGLEAAGFSPAQINSILAGRTTEERTAILQRETPLRVPETVRAAAAKFAQELDMANGAAGAMQQIAGMPSWASIKKADGTIEYTVKDTAGNVVTTTGSLQQAKLSFTEQAEKAMTEYLLQGQTQQAKEEAARETAEAGAELEILDVEGRQVAETSPAATIAFEAPVAGAAPDAGLARLNTKIQREDPSLNIREVIPSASQVSPVGAAVMDAVRALQGFTGRQVRFIEDVNGNELFFRGVVDPDDPNTIWIDARGTRSTLAIFGHEFTHTLEKTNPQLYQEFVAAITPYIGDLEVEHAKIAKRHGGKYTAPQLSKEYIANVAGDAFAHPELLNRLAKSNPGLFTKVVNALKQWFQQFKEYASTFGTETRVNVEKVQDQLVSLLEKVQAAGPYKGPSVVEPQVQSAPLEYALSPSPTVGNANWRAWFKDSKVVDAFGRPMVVYHGTMGNFTLFKHSKDIGFHFGTTQAANDRLDILTGGIPKTAGKYKGKVMVAPGYHGANIIPVYLSLQNPVRLPDLGDWDMAELLNELVDRDLLTGDQYDAIQSAAYIPKKGQFWQDLLRSALQAHGIDGIIYKNTSEGMRAGTPEEVASVKVVAGIEAPGRWFAAAQGLSEDIADYGTTEEQAIGRVRYRLANSRQLPWDDSYIIFEPSQAKSAISNVGTYGQIEPGMAQYQAGDIMYARKPTAEETKYAMQIERGVREVAAIGHYSDEEKAKVGEWVRTQLDAMPNVPKHGAKRSAIEAEMLAQVEADIREKRRENPDRIEPRTESDTGVTLPWAHVDISGVTTIFVPQSATQKKERVKAVAKWKSIPFSFEKVPKVGEHGLPWQTGKYEGEQTVAPAVLNLATGKVGQGRHHAEAYGDAGIELANLEEDTPLSQGTRVPNIQGFVTDKGRFTDEVGNYLVLTPEGMVASPMDAYTQHLATKMVDEFFARLAKGGHNAQVILDQIGWYENVIEKLRIEYGGFSDMFADFLGGFSPATGVVENWKNAVGFLEAVSNGKYDTLFEELHEWVAAGKTIKQWRDAKKPIPLKENDVTLFGSNTNNGLAAVLEMWREVKFGDPPKARNFTKNLIGKSLHATIDRWAARMLQRLAGHERIPIGMAETGVTGKHTTPEKFKKAMGLPDVSGQELPPTGQFGVGQIVFAKATEMMRQRDPARFKDLIPSSMQAMNWFVEKEFWAEMNWSSKEGEGGSFEEMLKKQNAQRFIIGLAQTREGFPGKVDFIPNTLQNVKFGEKLRKRLVDKIKKKGQFLAVRSKDSLGMFEQKPERSLDTELLTGVNIEPLDIVRIAAEEAGAAYQKSTFVARAIKNAERDNPNARPGIEVYFDHQVSMAEVQPVMDYLVSRGIDGFTAIIDARSKPNPDPEAGGPDQVWGVRMMWIPEYAVEGHDLADDWVAEGTKVHHILEDGVDQLEGMQGVAHAVVMQYDTVVLKTGLDYDERGIIETSPGRAIADAWRERFFRATTPQTVAQPGILQEGREPGAGDVPDRGEGRGPPEEPGADAVAETGEEDQFLNYARKPDYRPKKTVKAYKLFRQGKDGNLYPLFIDKNTPVPVGTWMVAKFVPTKGFAKRPGWHAGTLPYAGHLRSKKTGQKAVDRVWAEAEMPADKDWQPIADQQPRKDIRNQIPANGFYRFKTSKMQGGAWMIGGAVKVNRVLSNEEVAVILRQAGEQAQIEAETNGALSFARREGKFAQAKAEGPLDRGASIEAIFEQIHGAPTRKAETTARAYRAYQAVAARHEAEVADYQPPEVPDLDKAITELEGQETLSQENLALEEQAEIDASIQAASDEFDGPIADARDEVTRKALEREKRLYVSRKRKGIEAVYAERSKALATQFALQRQNTRTTVEQAQTAATAEGSAELKRMRRVQTFAELNAILRAIPMAMRGRAGIGMTPSLEGLSDIELTDFLTQRLQAIGRELERSIKADFVAAIEDVLDKAKPKKTKGGILKGQLADAQRVVDEIKKIKDLNNDQVALEVAGIEGQLTAPGLEPEQEERLHERHHLHLLFGDLSNRTAAELESALAVLQAIVQQGRTQWYLLEQQRLAKQRDQSAQLLEALGTASPEQLGKMQREEGFGMIAGGFINSHYSFFQFLQQQLPNLPFVTEWAERARRANAASEDFARKSSDRFTNVIKTAIGSNSALKTGAAVQKLQQPTVAGRTGEAAMTQLDAIQYLLSWDQSDIRARMIFHSWDEAAIQRLRDATNDPVSTAVKTFLAQEYAASWQTLNPVYRAMYGVDMPRIPNYAPSRYHHAGNESQVDNMFGGPTATAGTTPGFVHARINHKAQLRQMDAMHVYMQHMSQVGSWTNFAELIRELRGTMNDANVKMAMEKSLGSANYRSLNLWIDSMQRNGANKAAETLALDKMLGYMTKVKAVSTMAFSVKTSIMQTDSAFRFMAEIPLRAWWRTFLDPAFFSSIPKAWHSDTVQRRVQEGMSPDMQYLMQQGKLTPTGLLRFFRAGFIHIRYVAGAFDAFSSAAVFKYHLDEQTKAGVPAAEAEAYALDKMDAAMQRFSQPTMMTGKGLIGVNGSPLFKMIAMFTSDPMLKTSIMAHAAMQIRRGQDVGMNIQRIGSVFVWALISHVIASVYRDLFTDDEDEEIWSMQGFLQALALAPLSGWFMVGPALESLVGKLTGVYVHPKNSDVLWETVNRGERAVKNYEDALNFDDYPAMIKEWDNIIKTLAAVHPLATAAAGMANIAKPIAGAIENVKEAE